MIKPSFFKPAITFFSVLILTACAYPVSRVDQGGDVTAIYFNTQDEGVHVFVDGSDMGSAKPFDGKASTLAVSPGRHLVELRRGTEQILRKDLYIGEGVLLNVSED